jgi:hypothetical protein
MSGRSNIDKVGCLEIAAEDLDAVADLLVRGFAGRTRNYWSQGLNRQAQREVPPGFPRFGYMLDHRGAPVGVLLLIYSTRGSDTNRSISCNLSSGYVEDAFRSYVPMLTGVAQRHKDVLYLNISPAYSTWPIIEARGFRSYCGGLFFSLPTLSRPQSGMRVETIRPDSPVVEGLSEEDTTLLARHAADGCLSLACRMRDGHVSSFILHSMRIRGMWLPAMQLIYCRGVSEYFACASAIGRFLLKRGKISVALDANGPLKGPIGLYREPLGRKYFKGPQCPRLADLSDAELVIYGP